MLAKQIISVLFCFFLFFEKSSTEKIESEILTFHSDEFIITKEKFHPNVLPKNKMEIQGEIVEFENKNKKVFAYLIVDEVSFLHTPLIDGKFHFQLKTEKKLNLSFFCPGYKEVKLPTIKVEKGDNIRIQVFMKNDTSALH
jgi:hypothetical protein